jgi:hypothetical protein
LLLAAQPSGPVAEATRAAQVITIDGSLRETAWARATPQRGFLQRSPQDGAPAAFDTEFRVLYDDAAVYLGVRAHDPDPAEVRGMLTRRDASSPSDWVSVSLDTYLDRRTAFTFALNPAGVQRDWAIYDDVQVDESWDAVWHGAAAVDGTGWSAEMRIPLSQLRYSGENGHRWGLQVGRVVLRTNEESYWAPWPKASQGCVSLYGTLEKIGPLAPATHLELVPYSIVGGQIETGEPRPRAVNGAGVDMKVGIATNFTLTATVNPDFGQVEADPSTVNLTAAETFFAEKRDFFLEGRDLFQMRLGVGDQDLEQLFYSRRIGAGPHEEPDDENVRLPSETTIYTAAKVSGKTADGWSTGALHAVTAEESVPIHPGSRERQVVEPLTNYTVLSLHKDLRQGRSNVGLLLTGVHRRLEGTGLDWLHERAYTGGLRAQNRFADDLWSADVYLFGSRVSGSRDAIAETQQASQRYYQRPDADHVTFDPGRTSLSGFGAKYQVGRYGGKSVRGAIGGDTRSPGFEANDLGFQNGADFAVQWAWLQLRDDEPGNVWRSWALDLNAWGVLDYGGNLLNAGADVNVQAQLLNYWGGGFGTEYEANMWEPGALRGGSALRGEPRLWVWAWLESDSRHAVYGTVNATGNRGEGGRGYVVNVDANLVVRARSNIELSLGPSWSRNVDPIQYIDTPEDVSGAPHYVLARIRQTTLGLTLRANYTVSPTLSLQVYAQPFISAGAYDRYKEATAPGIEAWADRFEPLAGRSGSQDGVVTVDDAWSFETADFSFRELRSNVVLRWEYLPGSTLFLVWSHARSSETTDGRFDLGGQLDGLAKADGEHVVMIKLAYWLTP